MWSSFKQICNVMLLVESESDWSEGGRKDFISISKQSCLSLEENNLPTVG